jgi:hypothetical protein
MFTLTVPAAYARRKCGLFIEIAAANIDTLDLVCSEPINSGKKLTKLDLQPIMTHEAEPSHFLLVEGICRLQKQLALGKRWILAFDSDDPNFHLVMRHLLVDHCRKLHLVVLAHALKSWEEDPGVNFASIAHLFKAKHGDLRRLLRLIVSHEYSTDSQELLTLLQCTPTNIMRYLQWLDQNSKSLIAQMEKLSSNQSF